MRKKRIIIFMIIFSIILGGILYWLFRIDIKEYLLSQDVIYWDENVEIALNDYQAKPNESSNDNIYYYHGLALVVKDKAKNAYSRSFFDKSQSWIKDTVNFNFELENRLQRIRFDIYEVYSRKYNKRIKELQYQEGVEFEDFTTIGDSLYVEINKKLDEVFESDLTIEEKLKFWRPRIDKMIDENLN